MRETSTSLTVAGTQIDKVLQAVSAITKQMRELHDTAERAQRKKKRTCHQRTRTRH